MVYDGFECSDELINDMRGKCVISDWSYEENGTYAVPADDEQAITDTMRTVLNRKTDEVGDSAVDYDAEWLSQFNEYANENIGNTSIDADYTGLLIWKLPDNWTPYMSVEGTNTELPFDFELIRDDIIVKREDGSSVTYKYPFLTYVRED